MSKPKSKGKIAVIGGDLRQVFCAKKLSELGYETAVFGFENYEGDFDGVFVCTNIEEALKDCVCLVLPLPVTRDGVTLFMPFSDISLSLVSLLLLTDEKCVIMAGKFGDGFKTLCDHTERKLYDYYDRESFQIANAYLTAESAVSLAMNECKFSLKGKNVLVSGYGRIGKTTCSILKALGANVYASARKEGDLEWIRAYGYTPVNTGKLKDVVDCCRIIFNTIPVKVFDEKILCNVPKNCLIIDLASSPGGVDFEWAKKNGIKVIWALGLPGKNLYESAGRVVAETVNSILFEEVLE